MLQQVTILVLEKLIFYSHCSDAYVSVYCNGEKVYCGNTDLDGRVIFFVRDVTDAYRLSLRVFVTLGDQTKETDINPQWQAKVTFWVNPVKRFLPQEAD